MMTLRERLLFCCLEAWPKIQVRMEDFICMKQSALLVHINVLSDVSMVHFTVACLVAQPLNRSEAKVDLVMIQILLLFKCKLLCYHAN